MGIRASLLQSIGEPVLAYLDDRGFVAKTALGDYEVAATPAAAGPADKKDKDKKEKKEKMENKEKKAKQTT